MSTDKHGAAASTPTDEIQARERAIRERLESTRPTAAA
jgi:uncharacterized protein with beta-barrel porin domain